MKNVTEARARRAEIKQEVQVLSEELREIDIYIWRQSHNFEEVVRDMAKRLCYADDLAKRR